MFCYSSINSSYLQYLKQPHVQVLNIKAYIHRFCFLLCRLSLSCFLSTLNHNEMIYVKISIITNISDKITCCQPGYLSIVTAMCTKYSLSFVPLNLDDLLSSLLSWEHLNNRNRDSSVSIVTKLRAGGAWVRIAIGAKEFSLLQKPPDRLYGGALSLG